ncbi:MAG: hypothetical protein ABIQ86_06985 [Steroidobacteraceae bacterium]
MLDRLQLLLETIYDARSGHDVQKFLLTRRRQLPRERRQLAQDEELVLINDEGDAFLGVFIDAAVLRRLVRHDPLRKLDSANIADFWTALEGVSHFSYLMWNVGHDRGVSQLELELQAEVDKYIASWWLLRTQNPGYFPRELRRLLFERTIFAASAAPRLEMYAAASRYAARFCANLEAVLCSDRPALRHTAVAVLRRFYRLGSLPKLRHIDLLQRGAACC